MHGRIVFIDLLRGWAALVMIEVHVMNAFLLPQVKEAPWFDVLTFVNGLVAPAFLFVAGLVFAVVLEARRDEPDGYRLLLKKQAGRILLIWTIGYVLHIPVFSFSAIRNLPPEAWLTFYQSDILHCIAAGLLILVVLGGFLPSGRVMAWTLGGLSLVFVLTGVILGGTDVLEGLHPSLRAYADHRLSLFPLFPWIGFLLAGGAVGAVYVHEARTGTDRRFARGVAILGAALIVLYLPEPAGLAPSFLTTDRISPFFFALRLGIILLLLLACRQWVIMRKTTTSWVLDAGRESLLIYAGHLLILYGTVFGGRSLVDLYGGSATVPVCLAATVALTGLMVVAGRAWSALKRRSRERARAVVWAGTATAVLLFFVQ